ncbi:MAG TPA: CDP-alcohol phosphatidyltransferase family protein [Tepidisphaeraceae bacterium]|nr:CDP-alcohol phosphatidyltransferase family protein [Tepidisphaeraceae bacterium]
MPNLITGSRLVLAGAFFALLSFYQYEGRGDPYLLIAAFIIYVAALISDWLDGYLARKWKVEGAFGRVVDPFADKILVLGTFIFFAGKNFIIPDSQFPASHNLVKTITGVAPGMVVLLLARELLVTSLRGISESGGQNFGAVWAGKFKMGFQSGTILAILVYVTFLPWMRANGHTRVEQVATVLRDVGIWGTILITLYSGLTYIRKAVILFRQPGPAAAAVDTRGDPAAASTAPASAPAERTA